MREREEEGRTVEERDEEGRSGKEKAAEASREERRGGGGFLCRSLEENKASRNTSRNPHT